MGMNHAGEIGYLTRLARPTLALITNAGAAHVEGLGSVEAVARARAKFSRGLINRALLSLTRTIRTRRCGAALPATEKWWISVLKKRQPCVPAISLVPSRAE